MVSSSASDGNSIEHSIASWSATITLDGNLQMIAWELYHDNINVSILKEDYVTRYVYSVHDMIDLKRNRKT